MEIKVDRCLDTYWFFRCRMAYRLSHLSFPKRQTTISHKKYTTIWRRFARNLYDYCSATISGLSVNILYIVLLKASRLTTLRLFHDYFIGEITTIGYDYFKSCYDYSSRNATTIARPYWLSGESPKELRRWPPMVPRRPPRPCLTVPPGGGCHTDPVRSDCWPVPDCKPPGMGSIETPPG